MYLDLVDIENNLLGPGYFINVFRVVFIVDKKTTYWDLVPMLELIHTCLEARKRFHIGTWFRLNNASRVDLLDIL